MNVKRHMIGMAAIFALGAVPAMAQQAPGVARASDPAGLVKLLADYKPKLTKDDTGDPMIELDLDGYKGLLMFYGCDEEAHNNCDSLQFQAGFDLDKGWTAAEAIDISRQYRFASVHLDDEGDPWIKWDIITGTGIPAAVFMESVQSFSDVVSDTADIAFADEPDSTKN